MNTIINNESEELSIKEFFSKIKEWLFYLINEWRIFVLIGILGAGCGLLYSIFLPSKFTAKVSFILEEGKNSTSGLAGLASIAGQFGVDVGGVTGGSLLSVDNILLYLKSPSLAREVLLTPLDSSNEVTIADLYSTTYNLKERWEKDEKIGKVKFVPLSFSTKYTRLEDSLLQKIAEKILSEQFNVSRPDKKASFIDVSVQMRSEILAKIYCEQLVHKAIDRYVNLKTQRQKSTVDKLQLRVDSIASLLRQKTLSGSFLQNTSSIMDINPLYKTGTSVAVETTLRDKTLLSTIFASVTQNLEMAKFTLSQETPVIQIIDAPTLPLKEEKLTKLKSIFLFSLSFILIAVLYFITKRIYETIMYQS